MFLQYCSAIFIAMIVVDCVGLCWVIVRIFVFAGLGLFWNGWIGFIGGWIGFECGFGLGN